MTQTKDIRVRFNYADWLKLRRIFPGKRGESMAAYLNRYIQEMRKNEQSKKR